jgi:hypothetical protein
VGALYDTCEEPGPNKRFLLFAKDDIIIVNAMRAIEVADEFQGYDPVLSPDRRWLIFRAFDQRVSVRSEEYFVYDLIKTPVENRRRGVSGEAVIGVRVYPSEAGPAPPVGPATPDGVSSEMIHFLFSRHSFGSWSFYWTPDSRSVIFGDYAGTDRSIVLVSFDRGSFETYRHALSSTDLPCGDGQFVSAASMNGAVIQVAVCGAVLNIERKNFEIVRPPSQEKSPKQE